MKRLFLLFLMALLLCGCTAQNLEETSIPTVETLPAVDPTEPSGCYDPEHPMEIATGGAVRAYPAQIPDAYGLAMMGGDLVVFSGTEYTTLTKLTGENRYVTASVTLNVRIDPADPSVLVTDKGAFYFDHQTGELVKLGTGLKEIGRIPLPENTVGEPVVSADRTKVYYCTEHTVWELTVETGIHRMIKEVTETCVSAARLVLEDTVLNCSMADGQQIFLLVETGKTLWQGREDIVVCSSGQNWYACMPEGIVDAYIFGAAEGESRMLVPEDFEAECVYLPGMDMLMTVSQEEGAVLKGYDLSAGTCATILELEQYPLCIAEGTDRVWMLVGDVIYGWDVTATPSGDATVYTTQRYTLTEPDAAGYAQCEAYAQRLEERFGVKILLGAEAVEKRTREYDLTGEYLVPVMLRELEKLEALLEQYPVGMLQDAITETTGGTLYLCLVRQVAGSAELGVPGNVGGAQFWEGGDCYVTLAVGMAEHAWYRPLYYALETRLMSNSTACYDWEYLNPKGFDYDYNYILNQNRQDEGWLEGENRYFIDLFSMSFPREDRARIMEYAMMQDCQEFFASDAMQAKLKALCLGLREAYGLEKSPETFLWEQYLEEPLAYTK